MSAAPIPADLRAAAPVLAARFGAILAGLVALVAHGFDRHPIHAATSLPICTWLQRTAQRFTRRPTCNQPPNPAPAATLAPPPEHR